jgi:cardiolipin synthase
MSVKSDIVSGYSTRNKVELVKGGYAYFDTLLSLINNASSSIYIRVYILDDDQTGAEVKNALIAAAKKGVSVHIVADGYASQNISKNFIAELKNAGIHFRFFEPLLRSTHFYFGRRMHEKVVVIDSKYALVGGINIADRYNDVDAIDAWLDYAILIEGEAAFDLYKYCASDWKNEISVSKANPFPEEKCSVRIRRNDWVKGRHEVWKTYFNWFNNADESITIMCSYFLPGRVLRKRLALATQRGVKVKVILAGPSDVKMAKYAERYLYDWMLRNHLEIYEYQPTVLHAKMMVVDNHWATIGSFNVNDISAYASTELNVDVRNRPFATAVQEMMDNVIEEDCIRVTEKNLVSGTTLFKRFLQRSAYDFIRLVLNLFTFYFKHE